MPNRIVPPADVQAALASGNPVDFIDVRTGVEFAAVHAIGARHEPLSTLDPSVVMS